MTDKDTLAKGQEDLAARERVRYQWMLEGVSRGVGSGLDFNTTEFVGNGGAWKTLTSSWEDGRIAALILGLRTGIGRSAYS